MNCKSILFFLGINSLIVSFFSILNILYSIYFDFVLDQNSYLVTFIIAANLMKEPFYKVLKLYFYKIFLFLFFTLLLTFFLIRFSGKIQC